MAYPDDHTPPSNPGDTLARVLVIKLGALGDFAQALGAMKLIRETHRSADITLLTTPLFEALAKASGYFDRVETDGRLKGMKAEAALVKRLSDARYNMVYDLQSNGRTARYFRGWGASRPLWSGAVAGASHRHANPERRWTHNFDRLAEQLRDAGLGPALAGQLPLPDLTWVDAATPDASPAQFGLGERYALLVAGSSPAEPEKRWPADRFARLAGWLADEGMTPVLLGTRAEADQIAEIARLEPRAINLVGKTDLLQLAMLARHASIVIGGDTGPLHLAAAADAPCVCLFAQAWTPSMARQHGPILNPRTRLGHATPTGRAPVITVQSGRLDDLDFERVQEAARLVLAMEAEPTRATEIGQAAGLLHRTHTTFISVTMGEDKPTLVARLKRLIGL